MTYPDTPAQRFLASVGACPNARAWVADRDLATAWRECRRGDWMLWLIGWTIAGEPWSDARKPLVRVACQCARLALPIYEARYPGQPAPRECLDLFGRWAAGEDVPREDLITARRAAAVAAHAVAAAAAVADGAAVTAAYAAAVAAAVTAAYAAYAAAADAAERARVRAECADLCRAEWPECPVQETP